MKPNKRMFEKFKNKQVAFKPDSKEEILDFLQLYKTFDSNNDTIVFDEDLDSILTENKILYYDREIKTIPIDIHLFYFKDIYNLKYFIANEKIDTDIFNKFLAGKCSLKYLNESELDFILELLESYDVKITGQSVMLPFEIGVVRLMRLVDGASYHLDFSTPILLDDEEKKNLYTVDELKGGGVRMDKGRIKLKRASIEYAESKDGKKVKILKFNNVISKNDLPDSILQKYIKTTEKYAILLNNGNLKIVNNGRIYYMKTNTVYTKEEFNERIRIFKDAGERLSKIINEYNDDLEFTNKKTIYI